ncbi:MAG: MFS transporter [Myxococcota bacterium]
MSHLFTLSLVWLCVLGGLGAFFPFYSLYLRENAGLGGLQVGSIMAIPPLVGLVMQPVWGQLSDRSGSRVRVLFFLCLFAAAGYAALAWPRSYPGLALGTVCLAVFSVALLPNLVAVSLALTRRGWGHELGRVRVWGTVGFGIVVAGFPFLLAATAPEAGSSGGAGGVPGLAIMFPLAGGLVAVGALVTLALPRGGAESLRAGRGDWRELLRHRPFRRLMIYSFLSYLSVQGPMALFPILVRSQGGGVDAVSRMWILMLLLEVPLVAYLGASIARLGARGVIAIGMLAAGARWLVSGLTDDLQLMTAAQVLHGVTVWGVVLGIPMYVDAVVPERLRSTGQGLLAMLGVSLGGFLSNLGAGWLIDRVGPGAPATVGGLAALALGASCFLWLPRPTQGEGEPHST